MKIDSRYLQRLEVYVLKTCFHEVFESKKYGYEEQTAMYKGVGWVDVISYT